MAYSNQNDRLVRARNEVTAAVKKHGADSPQARRAWSVVAAAERNATEDESMVAFWRHRDGEKGR